jgi:hypothetical protein
MISKRFRVGDAPPAARCFTRPAWRFTCAYLRVRSLARSLRLLGNTCGAAAVGAPPPSRPAAPVSTHGSFAPGVLRAIRQGLNKEHVFFVHSAGNRLHRVFLS